MVYFGGLYGGLIARLVGCDQPGGYAALDAEFRRRCRERVEEQRRKFRET